MASHVGLYSASISGILTLDLSPFTKTLSGGVDRNSAAFDKSFEHILANLKGCT